jgi:hypothetical protein
MPRSRHRATRPRPARSIATVALTSVGHPAVGTAPFLHASVANTEILVQPPAVLDLRGEPHVDTAIQTASVTVPSLHHAPAVGA